MSLVQCDTAIFLSFNPHIAGIIDGCDTTQHAVCPTVQPNHGPSPEVTFIEKQECLDTSEVFTEQAAALLCSLHMALQPPVLWHPGSCLGTPPV